LIVPEYKLEKWIWTEKDFQKMGWHDATIYGMRLQQNLEFDIDYIFQWNKPEVEGLPFTFFVAPCTLIFNKPTNLTFDLTQTSDDKWFEISDIELESSDGNKRWNVITQQGNISFQSESYTQIVRRYPSFQFGQEIDHDERGGRSFDDVSGEKQVTKLSPDIIGRKKKELAQYEILKKRTLLKKELEKVLERRESGEIGLKEFSTRKKQLKVELDTYNLELKGTRFENSSTTRGRKNPGIIVFQKIPPAQVVQQRPL
jgi:hypothetical protein